jgi:hypothetical protein
MVDRCQTMVKQAEMHAQAPELFMASEADQSKAQRLLDLERGSHWTRLDQEKKAMSDLSTDMMAQINFLQTAFHQLNAYTRVTESQVETKFSQLIDACWPDDDDSVDTEGARHVVRRQLALERSVLASPRPHKRRSEVFVDKTMSLLRTLSSVMAEQK